MAHWGQRGSRRARASVRARAGLAFHGNQPRLNNGLGAERAGLDAAAVRWREADYATLDATRRPARTTAETVSSTGLVVWDSGDAYW